MDAEDLDRIGDFFQEIININNPMLAPVPWNKKMVKFVKNGLFASIRLMGVTTALVGANVISSYLIPDPGQPNRLIQDVGQQPRLQQSQINLSNFSSITKHAEICQIDFGCHKNICWRSCHTNIQEQNLWCYTSPTPNAREFYHCDDANDCFICWECIEPCHL